MDKVEKRENERKKHSSFRPREEKEIPGFLPINLFIGNWHS